MPQLDRHGALNKARRQPHVRVGEAIHLACRSARVEDLRASRMTFSQTNEFARSTAAEAPLEFAPSDADRGRSPVWARGRAFDQFAHRE